MARMMGPATSAPELDVGWKGTITQTATLGCVAGAKPIIQSWVLAWRLGRPVWAVPVLTAAFSVAGKIPAAVPEMATSCISASTWAATGTVMDCW